MSQAPVPQYLSECLIRELKLGDGGEDLESILTGVTLAELEGDPADILSFGSLCDLVGRYSSHPGQVNSLCLKLEMAAALEEEGQFEAQNNILEAFQNEVRAQIEKTFSVENALTLSMLAEVLKSSE